MRSLRFKNTDSRIERLSPVIERIRHIPVGKKIGLPTLLRLNLAWGNFGYSASIRYMQQVERLFRLSQGCVLECGSGVTTLLLALLAEKVDRSVWTFENHEEWGSHIRMIVRAFDLDNIQICHSPLKDYGDYEWYTLPEQRVPYGFGLVVCDGPPGTIEGGRYGLMPVMREYMRPDCRILLDDTHRRKEKALIRRWASERNLTWSPLGTTGRCAEIAFA